MSPNNSPSPSPEIQGSLYPHEEAKTQYAIDTLIYDEPWTLWWRKEDYNPWPNLYTQCISTPMWRKDHIYRRKSNDRI